MSSPANLSVNVENIDSAVVVSPTGEIDLTASPVLREELQRVQAKQPSKLVIDLSSVPYMDSSGVATLVEAMQVARKNKTAMGLCGLQERVLSIFEIARLDTVFRIDESRDQALAD